MVVIISFTSPETGHMFAQRELGVDSMAGARLTVDTALAEGNSFVFQEGNKIVIIPSTLARRSIVELKLKVKDEDIPF